MRAKRSPPNGARNRLVWLARILAAHGECSYSSRAMVDITQMSDGA